jgi:hypothetical protein
MSSANHPEASGVTGASAGPDRSNTKASVTTSRDFASSIRLGVAFDTAGAMVNSLFKLTHVMGHRSGGCDGRDMELLYDRW